MLRKEFTEDKKVTPPLKGRVDVELLAFVFQFSTCGTPEAAEEESRPVLAYRKVSRGYQ